MLTKELNVALLHLDAAQAALDTLRQTLDGLEAATYEYDDVHTAGTVVDEAASGLARVAEDVANLEGTLEDIDAEVAEVEG